MAFFEKYELETGKEMPSPFMNEIGVYQDGTTPMYRDVDGTVWAISGHSHMGHIGMFAGTTLDDMVEKWPINTNFSVGHADFAYSGIRYPDGTRARGSIWPFGLYICPNTHRFFCWFHNETGWNAENTAYDALGLCGKSPRLDSDFRHIGLMHSDDEGKHWVFDRWVLSAEEVGFTERYNPNHNNMIGQKGDIIRLGSGDFCMYIEPDGEYIYVFYNIIQLDVTKDNPYDSWQRCDGYVARCRKRTDGAMGDFVKYYNGSFGEAGNLGKESPIISDAWHPRVVYSEVEKMYIMTSKPIVAAGKGKFEGLDKYCKIMQISTSTDLINWTEPEPVFVDQKPWGNHYNAIISDDPKVQPNILTSNTFSILNNHNGTDVMRYKVTLKKK